MAPLNLLNQQFHRLNAVSYCGKIFVAYKGYIACYNPHNNEWKQKGHASFSTAYTNLFVDNDKLIATSHRSKTADFAMFEYDASKNEWKNERKQVR